MTELLFAIEQNDLKTIQYLHDAVQHAIESHIQMQEILSLHAKNKHF